MKFRKIAAQALAAAFVACGVVTATAAPALADSATYPLYDANGVERSYVSWNSDTHYAMSCYPSDFVLVIQVKLENDEVIPRRVDWAQCNVAGAYGEHTVVAVSGTIDGFQNEWHKVS